jgi:hypothetical protein
MIVAKGNSTIAATENAIPTAGLSKSPGSGSWTKNALLAKITINNAFMIVQ